jgi:tRNA acetyltransferase TAN1
MDLLVSYSWGSYGRASREVVSILKRFGDPNPLVEKSGVSGIAIAHTSLDNRDVIVRCRQLVRSEPAFDYAVKWVPVDYWCDSDLDTIKELIELEVAPSIGETETWGLKVEKRGWPKYHTDEIVEYLAVAVGDRKVNLTRPDKLVRVDILGSRTAISLLRPDEIFSIARL